MDRLDQNIIYATIAIALVSLLCVIVSFVWLKDSLFEVVGFSLFVSLSFGYIISSHLLSSKKTQDKNLSHLSQEILHELNIPLSTIQINTNMLKKHTKEEKLKKRLQRIEDASHRLHRLYKELSYTIKKEIQTIPKEKFDPQELIAQRVEEFSEQNRQKFNLNIQPIGLLCDKIGFEKVIDNLISNAMKYSDKNTTISIYTKNNKLYIQDEGCGMDEVELLRVFERYYQTNQTSTGEGIGLAIVKEYCDKNHIPIDIQSKPNQGTIVSLDLGVVLATGIKSSTIFDKKV